MARRPDAPIRQHPAFATSTVTARRAPRRRRTRARPLLLAAVMAVGAWFALGQPTSLADIDRPGTPEGEIGSVSAGSPTPLDRTCERGATQASGPPPGHTDVLGEVLAKRSDLVEHLNVA